MNSYFFNSFSYIILIFVFISIFSLSVFIPILSENGYTISSNSNSTYPSTNLLNSKFVWPTPRI